MPDLLRKMHRDQDKNDHPKNNDHHISNDHYNCNIPKRVHDDIDQKLHVNRADHIIEHHDPDPHLHPDHHHHQHADADLDHHPHTNKDARQILKSPE